MKSVIMEVGLHVAINLLPLRTRRQIVIVSIIRLYELSADHQRDGGPGRSPGRNTKKTMNLVPGFAFKMSHRLR